MKTAELICIECPRGCNIKVILNDNKIEKIEGNLCPKGKKYAESEVTAPVRVVTSTIRLKTGEMLSVKTNKPIPKEKIFNVMKIINSIVIEKPVKIGDIIFSKIIGDANLVATKSVEL